jgi:hypothetical protein
MPFAQIFIVFKNLLSFGFADIYLLSSFSYTYIRILCTHEQHKGHEYVQYDSGMCSQICENQLRVLLQLIKKGFRKQMLMGGIAHISSQLSKSSEIQSMI